MNTSVFSERLRGCMEELQQLYFELYQNDAGAFEYFLSMLENQWNARKDALRAIDEKRSPSSYNNTWVTEAVHVIKIPHYNNKLDMAEKQCTD